MLEMDYDNDDEKEQESKKVKFLMNITHWKVKVQISKAIKTDIPDSKLEKSVADLVELICDVKQYKEALVELEIDIKKMPLGTGNLFVTYFSRKIT